MPNSSSTTSAAERYHAAVDYWFILKPEGCYERQFHPPPVYYEPTTQHGRQAKLVVLRTVASSTASTLSGSGTSIAAYTNNGMSLEEYLASPSPRCCACNTRGGYQQDILATSTVVSACDRCPTLKTNVAAGIRSMHASHVSTESRGSSLHSKNVSCRQSSSGADGALKVGGTDTLVREEQLVTHLEECLKCMTHLRDWLRIIDHEIG